MLSQTNNWAKDASAYWVDAAQRSILFLDAMRKRGNLYLEHRKAGKPPVLTFDYDMIVDGRKLEHRVKILRPFRTPDQQGGHFVAWASVRWTRAAVIATEANDGAAYFLLRDEIAIRKGFQVLAETGRFGIDTVTKVDGFVVLTATKVE